MSLGDFLAEPGWCCRHPSLDALVDRYVLEVASTPRAGTRINIPDHQHANSWRRFWWKLLLG